MFAVCASLGSGIAYYQIWNLINKEPLQRRNYEMVGHKGLWVSSPWELAWRGGSEKCFCLGEQVIAQRREKMPRAASLRSLLNGSAGRWRVSPCLPCSVSTRAGGAEGLLLCLLYTERLMLLLKEKGPVCSFWASTSMMIDWQSQVTGDYVSGLWKLKNNEYSHLQDTDQYRGLMLPYRYVFINIYMFYDTS